MVKTRVLLVDDHAILRSGLRLLITMQADLEVVGEAANTREALALAHDLRPDVITLDLVMPGGGSMKLIESLQKECPKIRVIVLTMHDDAAHLRTALAAGAAGFVTKSSADVELLDAIRAVARGRIYVAHELSEPEGVLEPIPTGVTALSSREREVLASLARGYTNQEIADKLFLSVKTIETYRSRLGEKLGLKTRSELIRYAQGLGLLDTDSERD